MSSQSAEQTTSPYRMPLAVGIVALSIVVPVAVIWLSAVTAFGTKFGWGSPAHVRRLYQGQVRNSQLLLSESSWSKDSDIPVYHHRYQVLDIHTGAERDLGVTFPGYVTVIWIGDKLYATDESAIFEVVGTELVRVAVELPQTPPLACDLFEYGGQLTTVRQTTDGKHRLHHLMNGEWKAGRQIVLPGMDWGWYDDPQRSRVVLSPPSFEQQLRKPWRGHVSYLRVLPVGQQIHLLITDFNWYSAYRRGFEFADEATDAVSALSPQNALNQATGWQAIDNNRMSRDRWAFMENSRDGLVFISIGEIRRAVRQTSDGKWTDFEMPRGMPVSGTLFTEDPDHSTSYFLSDDQQWNSLTISRVEGNKVHPPRIVVKGCYREYIDRWLHLLAGVLLALAIHAAVLAIGADWQIHGRAMTTFESGTRRATLASASKRALATAIDGSLLILTLGFSALVFAWGCGFDWPLISESRLAYVLLSYERFVGEIVNGNYPISMVFTQTSVRPLLMAIMQGEELIRVLSSVALAATFAKVCLEGRYGITPGKWLLGLRTVRTTLRPCGVARAIVRNVFYCFDLPLLLTPLPAAISLMFSDHRQRLGDRVADTIVVRAGSMREVS